MAPVARELCSCRGVLEPLQTARTVGGQVEELKMLLEVNAKLPVTLIGFSWGAWLSFILAARHPALVSGLVLVASGPFRESYARQILPTRLSRLDEAERREVEGILAALDDPVEVDSGQDRDLARLGRILSRCDAFDPVQEPQPGPAEVQALAEVYQSVWKEAEHLRRTGELLDLGKKILCPVVALHGDWDPHPAEGVREPLSSVLKSFQFILLRDCGHKPWMESRAKDKFHLILKKLIAQSVPKALNSPVS
jgi:pimeloyl-ACP methyl ester carboxylesterase